MSTPTRLLRALAIGSAGVGTFYAAAQLTRTTEQPSASEIVQPAARASSSAAAAIAPAPPPALPSRASGPTRARALPEAEGEAFSRLSWLPPPPPPPPPPPVAPPPPPPPPAAPPLPFTFVGMVEEGVGKPQAFLSRGDTLLIVAAGDIVESNTYRIDSLSPTQVVLTYLPLNTKQTIEITGASK